jgi:hypothetical protein
MSLAYSDFHWVDTALGDWRHRNRPMVISKLRDALPEDPRDCFATWHRFPKAYAKHVEDRGTVSGYDGASYADFLPIDFDGEDLGQVQQQVRDFLRVLEVNLEVDGLQGVRVFFSGAKGFHVCLSAALFGGWEPSATLPRMLKDLAQRITKGFETDPAIYDQNRLLRLPNTINSKSDRWKVALPAGEVIRENIDTIINDLANGPREVVWPAWEDVTPSPVCAAMWASVSRQEPREPRALDTEILFCTGMREGDGRDKQAFSIARYCRDHGFSESVTNQLLEVWDAAQTDPLGVQTLHQKSRSAYSRIDGDGKAEITASDVLTPAELADQYDRYIEQLRTSKLTFGLGPVDGRLRGVAGGEVCTIIAKAGTGKTAMLQNILRHVAASPDITSLFCSLEQPLAQVFERYAQMGLTRAGEDIEKSWPDDAERDLIATTVKADLGTQTLTCARSLSVSQLDQTLDIAEEKAGRPVNLIAIDYLGLLDTRELDKSLYGQVSRAAREMKNLAKRRNLAVLCLCQVSRSAGDDGSQPLTINSARESGAIEEAADFLLGMYRPDMDGDDKTIMVQILKNRKGQERVEFAFDFDKVSLRITPRVLALEKTGGQRREY